jgi:hypothetical protein
MRYKRNSRHENSKSLTVNEQNSIASEIVADAKFIQQLDNTKQYSSEWVHTVLLELLMQCMGKKTVTMGIAGEEKTVRIFKEKAAVQIVGMIAKMNGHLFDVMRGEINTTVSETIEHQITLETDTNRTQSVLEILENCGGLQRETKRLTRDDVEVISA